MSANEGPENQQGPDNADGPAQNDVINTFVIELRSFKKQQHEYKEAERATEKRRHFWNVITAIGVCVYTILTAIILVIGVLSYDASQTTSLQQHSDTTEALYKTEISSIQQHTDTVRALIRTDTANGIARDAAQGQIRAMQAQIDEMKRQSALTENQSLPKMEMSFSSDPGNLTQGSVSIAGRWITPVWQNRGTTDALDFWAWDNSFLFAPDVPENFDFLTGGDVTQTSKTTVGPSEPRPQISRFITESDMQSVIDGKGKLVIWGFIEYRESLPGHKLHQIHWCNLISPIKSASGYVPSFPIFRQTCNRRN